jgi:hypothetical protein
VIWVDDANATKSLCFADVVISTGGGWGERRE